MMILAFVTGAVASGFIAAALATLLVWGLGVISGSSGPAAIAPWLFVTVAAVVGVATYRAEGIARRRMLAEMRATGEPWAYRG